MAYPWDFDTPIWHERYLDYPDFVGSPAPGPTEHFTFDGDELYHDEATVGISTGVNFDVTGDDPPVTMDPDEHTMSMRSTLMVEHNENVIPDVISESQLRALNIRVG